MAEPVQVTDITFDAEVLKNDLIVLASFWSEWSTPSKKMTALLENVAKKFTATIKLVALNIDEAPRTTSAYGVLNVPTVIVFRNSQPVETIVGPTTQKEIEKKISPYLPID